MTAARERRLLASAIGYARADEALRLARLAHRTGESPDQDGSLRARLAVIRYRWKQRIIRAAGFVSGQGLLPLDLGFYRPPETAARSPYIRGTKPVPRPPDSGGNQSG